MSKLWNHLFHRSFQYFACNPKPNQICLHLILRNTFIKEHSKFFCQYIKTNIWKLLQKNSPSKQPQIHQVIAVLWKHFHYFWGFQGLSPINPSFKVDKSDDIPHFWSTLIYLENSLQTQLYEKKKTFT